MACISCGRGFIGECACSPDRSSTLSLSTPTDEDIELTEPTEEKKISTSAGRKRAAVMYAIDPVNPGPCEWRGLKNAGGGKKPIIGCPDGVQKHRHHGPIKDTSHNESGNLHRICSNCHNRWHTLNDPIYDEEEYSQLPHKPEVATLVEVIENDVAWKEGNYSKKVNNNEV